ncbi:MAG: Crp/Fnr family transcriptional regulator [Pseudomonadota bacterium]
MPANPLQLIDNTDAAAAAAIAEAPPFNELPEQVIASLAEASSVRSYSAGETVFAMGQFDGSEFLIVRSGKLQAAHADQKSGSMLIEHVRAGDVFGLAFAVIGEDMRAPVGVSLAAESDCEIVAIDAAALRLIVSQRPSLTRNLMLYFARKVLGDERVSEESSPERRVYAALSALAERDAVTAEWRISRMPKHRELADRADVDEADAANAVAKLIQSGVARRDYPGLIIDDMAQLGRLAR